MQEHLLNEETEELGPYASDEKITDEIEESELESNEGEEEEYNEEEEEGFEDDVVIENPENVEIQEEPMEMPSDLVLPEPVKDSPSSEEIPDQNSQAKGFRVLSFEDFISKK
jgi:hypothetical protein